MELFLPEIYVSIFLRTIKVSHENAKTVIYYLCDSTEVWLKKKGMTLWEKHELSFVG